MSEDIDLSLDFSNQNPASPATGPKPNQMHMNMDPVQGMFAPGCSDEEMIDRIIETPISELIPWEDCVLPSKGLYYGWQSPTIKVRAMTQNNEQTMANQRLAQSGQSLNAMLAECCQFPEGFGPADLLVGDYSFILYYIRGISYGEMYEFMLDCPACKKTSTHSYDLRNLADTIMWANESRGPEPFKVTLPVWSAKAGRPLWVGLRFLRMGDISSMVARGKVTKRIGGQSTVRNKKQQQQQIGQDANDILNDNISTCVVSVNGVTDPFKIRAFCQNLHATDSSTIRSWLADNSPGIDTSVVVTCPECAQEFGVGLPITESFFRPAKQ